VSQYFPVVGGGIAGLIVLLVALQLDVSQPVPEVLFFVTAFIGTTVWHASDWLPNGGGAM